MEAIFIYTTTVMCKAQATVVGATAGPVVLHCVRKQAEHLSHRKHASTQHPSVASASISSSEFYLGSYPNPWTVMWRCEPIISPFLLKLIPATVFITATESKSEQQLCLARLLVFT